MKKEVFYIVMLLFYLMSCDFNQNTNVSGFDYLLNYEYSKDSCFQELYGIDYDTLKLRLSNALEGELTPKNYFAMPLYQKELSGNLTKDIFANNINLFKKIIDNQKRTRQLDLKKAKEQHIFRSFVAELNLKLFYLQFPLMIHENPSTLFNYNKGFLYRNFFNLQFASFTEDDLFYEVGFFLNYENQTEINRFEEAVILNDYILRGITYTIAKEAENGSVSNG